MLTHDTDTNYFVPVASARGLRRAEGGEDDRNIENVVSGKSCRRLLCLCAAADRLRPHLQSLDRRSRYIIFFGIRCVCPSKKQQCKIAIQAPSCPAASTHKQEYMPDSPTTIPTAFTQSQLTVTHFSQDLRQSGATLIRQSIECR